MFINLCMLSEVARLLVLLETWPIVLCISYDLAHVQFLTLLG